MSLNYYVKIHGLCQFVLKKTLPLVSHVLQSLTSLDPALRGNSVCSRETKTLVRTFSHLLTTEGGEAEEEVRHFKVDGRLTKFMKEKYLVWRWANLKSNPLLKAIALAALSIFYSPQVRWSHHSMSISSWSVITLIKLLVCVKVNNNSRSPCATLASFRWILLVCICEAQL